MVNDRARRVLIAAALLALAWALLIWLSGGIDARILGVTVRARGVVRPLVVSVVLLSAAGWVSRGSLRDLPAAASILVPWFAGTLAFITVVDALRYGSFVAAGSRTPTASRSCCRSRRATGFRRRWGTGSDAHRTRWCRAMRQVCRC